jgi:Trk K+ transport system NAD-binding subunit
VERKDAGAELNDHVVICNVNAKVRTIVAELHRREPGLDVVLVVQDSELWSSRPDWHPDTVGEASVTTLDGCPTDGELLDRARIAEARAAVILADPRQGVHADARSALVALAIEHANPQVHTVIELLLSVNLGHLHATVVNEVICLGEIAEKLVAQACISPGSSRIFAHLLTTARETSQVFLAPVPGEHLGRTFRETALAFIDAALPVVVCGFVKASHGSGQAVVLNPRTGSETGRDTVLESGDRLVVLAADDVPFRGSAPG